MFDNIGAKIKTLAQVVTWVGIIGFVVLGMMIGGTDDDLVGLGFLIMIVGGVGAWISSFVLYGFGQLIENSDYLVRGEKGRALVGEHVNILEKNESAAQDNDLITEREELWRCSKCGREYTEDTVFCTFCGIKRE